MFDLDSLAACEVDKRIPRLAARLGNLDALLICRLPNICYLTGFTGSAAMLLVRKDGSSLFISDGRYTTQSKEQLAINGVDSEIAIRMGASEQLDVLADALGDARRLGLEDSGITWSQARQYIERFSDVECVAAGQLVEELRRAKDDGEVDRIRAACAIADEAFAEMLPKMKTGISEREFALELEFAMRRRGASAVSFDPIIASGPNAAKPHARPSDRIIVPGELIICDFGCIVDGYCSDMTRTVSIGDPSTDAASLYELVLYSQTTGRDLVRAGVDVFTVDKACRDIIDAAGYGAEFSHGTGHGVGVEIHEAPRLAKSSSGSLIIGDIVTVEPGVYLPGVGGVRIEDTVLVTAGGYEALTLTPKTLVI